MKTMMSKKERTEVIGLGIKLVAIAIVLVLSLVASLGWFSEGGNNPDGFSAETLRVKYDFDGTSENIFVQYFDVADADYEEDDSEIDEYIPATGATIYKDELLTEISNPLTMERGKNVKLRVEFNPKNSTDKKSWATSNENVATVNKYGRILAVGIGTARITFTATDRTPGSTRENITIQINIIVTERTSDSGGASNIFLPAGATILNKPVRLFNLSSANSKLRVEIKWEYSNIGGDSALDGVETGRTQYETGALFSGVSMPIVLAGNGLKAPILPQFAKSNLNETLWHNIPSPGKISLLDSEGISWTISKMSLTDQQHSILTNSPIASNVQLNMIDSASAVFYFGTNDYVSSPPSNYGNVISAVNLEYDADGNLTQETLERSAVNVLNQIVVNNSYSAYSIFKMFNVSVVFQARQADYYVSGGGLEPGANDSWFNVFSCDFKNNAKIHTAH